MKFVELSPEVQEIAANCVSQLVVKGAEPTKELALSIRDTFISMYEAVTIKDADITQDNSIHSPELCGDEPFIYSGNCDLTSLIHWLEDELNNLRSTRNMIIESSFAMDNLIQKARTTIQYQPLINNLRHRQDSSLLSDSNQYSKDLGVILTELDTFLISSKSYQGLGLPVKQTPSVEVSMHSEYQMSNDV